MCILNSTHGKIQRYFNNDKSTQIQSDSTIGLNNIFVTNNNGILFCQFNKTKEISSIPNYFSLFNSYYVFLAKGSLDGGNLIKVCHFNVIFIEFFNF